MTREERLELVREFLRQYDALERKDCDEITWIMLKLNCSDLAAKALIKAARTKT